MADHIYDNLRTGQVLEAWVEVAPEVPGVAFWVGAVLMVELVDLTSGEPYPERPVTFDTAAAVCFDCRAAHGCEGPCRDCALGLTDVGWMCRKGHHGQRAEVRALQQIEGVKTIEIDMEPTDG